MFGAVCCLKLVLFTVYRLFIKCCCLKIVCLSDGVVRLENGVSFERLFVYIVVVVVVVVVLVACLYECCCWLKLC